MRSVEELEQALQELWRITTHEGWCLDMIRLGTLAGYSFDGPMVLGGWTPPNKPAVYVIVYKPDPEAKPENYAVIYVGHSEDLTTEGFPFKHPRAHCWLQRAGSKWKVYICVFEVPGGSQGHREMIAHELMAIYDPHCNVEKYEKAWKDEWIGDYSKSDTTSLAPRGPDEQPQ